jgi:hypothetical protein
MLRQEAHDPHDEEAVLAAGERTFQKLCARLARWVTGQGCQSLLAHALHLAAAEAPFLANVRAGIPPATCLEGLRESRMGTSPADTETGLVVALAHMLGLLSRFIGAGLTRRLIEDVWPNAPLSGTDSDQQEAVL